MSRRAEQNEQDERAKARARVHQSPITEATDAHSMGKVRAGSTRSSDTGSLIGLVLLETVKRNNAAYESVMPQLEAQWKLMQVKRRFDRSQ
jgi:hypothetical protein